MEKKSIIVEISGSEEIAEGVYRTTLTHPLLDGKLFFLHSSEESREELIKTLASSWKDEAVKVVRMLSDVEEVLTSRKNLREKQKQKNETTDS